MVLRIALILTSWTLQVHAALATRFAEPIRNVTVTAGREAVMSCVVDDVQDSMVAWIHVDRQMVLTVHNRVVTRMSRFSVTRHENGRMWKLHIQDVKEEDRGTYMCQVNTEPMMKQTGHLEILVPPSISDELSSASVECVQEYGDITLTCRARGRPQPEVIWRREDNRPVVVRNRRKVNISHGDTLSLSQVTRHQMSAYLCIASNGVPPSVSKRITLEVLFPPSLRTTSQLLGAPIGSQVMLDCHCEAYPSAIMFWMLGDVMILTNKKYEIKEKTRDYSKLMTLIIKNTTTSDFGDYRCIAKNSNGEATSHIRLYGASQELAAVWMLALVLLSQR